MSKNDLFGPRGFLSNYPDNVICVINGKAIEKDSMNDDTRPFPIQRSLGYRDDTGEIVRPGPSVIPWWLAEEVYRGYVLAHGQVQTLERIAERGGFSRDDVLYLLRYISK